MTQDKESKTIRFTDARLQKAPSERLVKYVNKPEVEAQKKMFNEFNLTDRAHTVMLAEQKIIDGKVARKIVECLLKIRDLGPEKFPVDPTYGSLLLQIERFMTDAVGEENAGWMHTGRSRIDMNACVWRLWCRNRLLDAAQGIVALQKAILDRAERNVETVMPGYTHLQHAQPWTFGHYLTGQAYVLERDFERITGAYGRTNLNALGTAALAGTSWPLSREQTSEFLGFDGLVKHAKDAGVFAPDYVAEILAVWSILMSNLGRMCGDFYVWSTSEFGLVEMDDSYAGTSSIMPQKKNPYPIETVRAMAGMATGYLPSVLGALKMATSTDCDAVFVDLGLPGAAESVVNALDFLTGVVETLIVHKERMAERAGLYWSTASNLADDISKSKGVPFRTSHHVVARLVRNAIKENKRPADVTSKMVDQAALETTGNPLGLSEEAVKKALDPLEFVKSRTTVGSVNPKHVREMLDELRTKVSEEERWLQDRHANLKHALEKLEQAEARILRS